MEQRPGAATEQVNEKRVSYGYTSKAPVWEPAGVDRMDAGARGVRAGGNRSDSEPR